MHLHLKQKLWSSRFRWVREIVPGVERAEIAWRFFRHRSTSEDGYSLIDAGEDATGFYGIRSTGLDSMVEQLEERYGELTPAQKDRALDALKRSIEKWDWYDDGRSDLEDNAIERFLLWSEQAGDAMLDRDEEAATG